MIDKYQIAEMKRRVGEKLKIGGVRQFVNNNSAVVTVGAVAIIIVGLAAIIKYGAGNSTGTAPATTGWFWDVEDKAAFVDEATNISPFKRPNGHTAVRLHYFSCGDCTKEQRFVGYMEKYTDEVRDKLEKSRKGEITDGFYEEEQMAGLLYSKDGETWFSAQSPEGQMLVSATYKKCPDRKQLQYCPPSKSE